MNGNSCLLLYTPICCSQDNCYLLYCCRQERVAEERHEEEPAIPQGRLSSFKDLRLVIVRQGGYCRGRRGAPTVLSGQGRKETPAQLLLHQSPWALWTPPWNPPEEDEDKFGQKIYKYKTFRTFNHSLQLYSYNYITNFWQKGNN